jgi:hypothetical protein
LFQLHPNADANTAAVARADDGGFCFFEVDRANYHSVIEKMTGHKFPDTFCVSSRPGQGRGHFYFKHTAASIALGNAQAKDENGELWSFRANDRYVVGPLSVHPEGPTHTVVKNSPIASVPDWLVQWISQNKSSAATKVAADNKSEIVEGGRNNALTSLAGKLRQAGLDSDQIHTTLLEENQKRCVPPLPDTEVRTIAYSVGRYPVAPDAPPVIMGGKNLSDPTATPVEDMSWLDTSQAATRPVFPTWIMYGTSLFEGLAKPVSDVNAKHPELIWLPAVQLLMNYMSGKVEIDKIRVHTNMFLGIISSPGKFFKSSSCKLAHEYFEQMLLVKKLTPNLRNAEGTVVIGQAGSSEGFGAQMYKANAKHGVLFNDELGKLVSKAGIENSSLPHDLLQWYESSDYSNPVKTAKSNFAFEAGTYCFGWQFCTTVRGFNSQWARIAGIASGMPDRMFFLLSPEQPKPMSPENYVNTSEGAFKTKQLIEQAMTQKTYTIASYVAEHLRKKSSALNDPRSMNMVYKFALYFAIDLGLDEIDEDCVDRALALVDYRQKAIAFLQPIEARNEEGRLLLEIKRELRQHGGKMTRREFAQNMHPEQHGERVWNMVYKGAISGDHIHEFTEQGARGQTRRMVGLVTDDVRLGPE